MSSKRGDQQVTNQATNCAPVCSAYGLRLEVDRVQLLLLLSQPARRDMMVRIMVTIMVRIVVRIMMRMPVYMPAL